tara:strand:- start:845 stop:1312 length:468 start_codon:yes stop_codon:yes gene_type:complete
MFKIKNLILFILISLFLNNCGYTPRYAENKNINFSLEVINFSGDRDFNNSIKSKLKRYSKNKNVSEKNFKISGVSKYYKIDNTKDSTGTATEYKLRITVNFLIVSENLEKKIEMEETFVMKKMDDSFEESNYETTIKNNFADLITEKLIFYLYQL